MTAPAPTAACSNPDCPEFEVPKDMSLMPPGFAPVLCGICGEQIDTTQLGTSGAPQP